MQTLRYTNGFKEANSFAFIYGKELDWKTVVNAIDTNRDGQIDFNEFVTAAHDRMKMINDENLQNAFKILDLNGDGRISSEEIKHAFSHGSMSDLDAYEVCMDDNFWEKFLTDIDKDHDGYIDFAEFKEHMLEMIDDFHCLQKKITSDTNIKGSQLHIQEEGENDNADEDI